jgi:hypothetical protein
MCYKDVFYKKERLCVIKTYIKESEYILWEKTSWFSFYNKKRSNKDKLIQVPVVEV